MFILARMENKIPDITSNDIKRIIKRDFPNDDLAEIMEMLSEYKSNTIKGRNRIHACILKLANGDKYSIEKYVERAKCDSRDVIAWAEYPNQFKHPFHFNLPKDQQNKLIEDDWLQYQAWFNR